MRTKEPIYQQLNINAEKQQNRGFGICLNCVFRICRIICIHPVLLMMSELQCVLLQAMQTQICSM